MMARMQQRMTATMAKTMLLLVFVFDIISGPFTVLLTGDVVKV